MERGCSEARLLRIGRCGVVVLCGLRLLLVYFIHRDCIARIVALRGTAESAQRLRDGWIEGIEGRAHRGKDRLCWVHRRLVGRAEAVGPLQCDAFGLVAEVGSTANRKHRARTRQIFCRPSTKRES